MKINNLKKIIFITILSIITNFSFSQVPFEHDILVKDKKTKNPIEEAIVIIKFHKDGSFNEGTTGENGEVLGFEIPYKYKESSMTIKVEAKGFFHEEKTVEAKGELTKFSMDKSEIKFVDKFTLKPIKGIEFMLSKNGKSVFKKKISNKNGIINLPDDIDQTISFLYSTNSSSFYNIKHEEISFSKEKRVLVIELIFSEEKEKQDNLIKKLRNKIKEQSNEIKNFEEEIKKRDSITKRDKIKIKELKEVIKKQNDSISNLNSKLKREEAILDSINIDGNLFALLERKITFKVEILKKINKKAKKSKKSKQIKIFKIKLDIKNIENCYINFKDKKYYLKDYLYMENAKKFYIKIKTEDFTFPYLKIMKKDSFDINFNEKEAIHIYTDEGTNWNNYFIHKNGKKTSLKLDVQLFFNDKKIDNDKFSYEK